MVGCWPPSDLAGGAVIAAAAAFDRFERATPRASAIGSGSAKK
jgi:hypothetical protein